MNFPIILILVGLSFNTLASLIVLYPYLSIKKDIDGDFIIDANKQTGKYTQKKHIKDRRLGVLGFALFAIGFILQIIGIILQI